MNLSIRNFFTSAFFGWLIIAALGLFYLFTFKDGRVQLRPDRLKFGIDLVGGTYITLSVQTEKAIEAEMYDKMQSLINQMKKANIEGPKSHSIQDNHIIYKFDSVHAVNDAAQFIGEKDNALKTVIEDTTLKVSLKDVVAQKIREWAVHSNIDVLRTRLGVLGEITIAPQGEKNIIIELPNVDDPKKAKAMIGKAALLEIKLIERMAGSEDEILDEYDGELPDGMEIIPGKDRHTYYLVPKYTDLTGRLLKDAYTGFGGQTGTEIVVHFKFSPEGGEKFRELTRKNYNRNLAVILDGIVISAPRVSTEIGAEGYIHGDFTQEGAAQLASLLKSGAFVAPVTFEEERQIGPTLGQESINAGLMACLFGLVLLFFFSLIMYKLSGFFAFLTLLYNLLVIMLALAWLRATLTLPGIAGMVLTTGMAIDASILIFEKIKEELATGITIRKAVDLGFSDAMVVILDSNITTFLVGAVLYKFGTGPIQGFAVTMMVGIIATLITGLFFLRSLFNLLLSTFNVQKLSI
ncbi:MAG: protein translocase subunit SecD [Candidatus Babeliales bacterium]